MNHVEHGDVAARARALAKQLVRFAEDVERGGGPKPAATRVEYDPDLPVAKSEPAEDVDDGRIWRIPFGHHTNVPIAEADDDTLRWLSGRLESDIADPAKVRWHSHNVKLRAAVGRELRTRFQ
jgi:hypothetical protein